MDDFDGPSFSLGVDFEEDFNIDNNNNNNTNTTINCINNSNNNDDDFDIAILDRIEPNQTLNRLKRPVIINDEIEDFSSDEEPSTIASKLPSSHPYSGCSTSKLPLYGHRVLTTQSMSKCKMTQKKQVADIPVSTSMKADSNTFTFPKLTVSPLRKFQLVDSDSEFDDPCASKYMKTEANKVNSSSKINLGGSAKSPTLSGKKRTNPSGSVSQGQDLWEDFYKEKSNVPTPALDDFCEEHLRSVKNKRTDPPSTNFGNCSRNINNSVQTHIIIDDDGVHCKLNDPIPPAHHYFYNNDLRIRDLVRSRLPYFFPLGAVKGESQHSVPSVIDYRSQFNHGESSLPKAAQMANAGSSSKRVRKNSRQSNLEEALQESGSWVNPRNSVHIPTDAGKRRVQAVSGQSSGHWFTSPEGKKVYVSKTGQELSGRAAYSQYRKESGKGVKRSGGKKKTAGKKKIAGKKKTASKKKTTVKKR